MEESIKQKQVASLLEQEINNTFRKLNLFVLNNGMVSISYIKVTPDLLEAKIYLSFFQIEDKTKYLLDVKERIGEIRKEVGNKIKNKLRKIPVLNFYEDESVERGFKIEALLKQIEIPKEDIDS